MVFASAGAASAIWRRFVPLSLLPASILLAAPPGPASGAALATYVSNPAQERSASILLQSLRRFGGPLRDVPFYVAAVNSGTWFADRLEKAGAKIIPVGSAPGGLAYPFLAKTLALAETERRLRGAADAVIYLDAETVVLGDLSELIPRAGKRIAIRPVHLSNKVGAPAGQPLDAYWQGIYGQLGRPPGAVPSVRSLVDQQELHPYYTCIAFGFDPSPGLMAQWKDATLALMADGRFQRRAVTTDLHRFFLHQAVLSALLNLHVKPEEFQSFPPAAAYPLALHARMPAAERIASLDAARSIYVDTMWQAHRDWWRLAEASPAIAGFLSRMQTEWRSLREGLYWEAGRANSYLIATPGGNVVVDPGGVAGPQSILRRVSGPLKAIVFTHSHTDHTSGSAAWRRPGVAVIAQREWKSFRDYHDRLAGFFARRDAAQGNVAAREPGDPLPTISFGDSHSFAVGGRRFELWHAPGETPDHLLFWVPHWKAVFTGDNVFGAFPNLAPPRGAPPRWPRDWIASLDRILALQPELLCAGHLEPLYGRENIRAAVTRLRDAIRYVEEATVQGMNVGKTLPALLSEIRLPPHLVLSESYARVAWAVRGVYQSYGGWFDENPATLFDSPPGSVAADLAELAGGTGPLVERARAHLQAGRPLPALHLLDIALAARPGDPAASTARVEVLKALAGRSQTFVERRWIQHVIDRAGRE